MIISIEGIDGAGKNTLVRALTSRIDAATLTFPRYDTSIHAQLAARALHGQMGDLVDSAHGMATLFALDRYGAREVLDRYADSDEVLLLDRYVASNAAYTAARLKDDAAFDWVYDLEFGQLGLPVPHLQVLLERRWTRRRYARNSEKPTTQHAPGTPTKKMADCRTVLLPPTSS